MFGVGVDRSRRWRLRLAAQLARKSELNLLAQTPVGAFVQVGRLIMQKRTREST
jgi:hypothetical protein